MSSTIKISLLVIWLATPFAAHAQKFIEGTHYSRIEQSIGAKAKAGAEGGELVEYFSFSCPGCYAMEPAIKALAKSRPDLQIRLVHTPYGGRKAKFSQRAFVLMSLLGAHEHRDRIFDRIHVQKNPFDSDEEIVSFFENLGYERSQLEANLNSFSADSLLRKMNLEIKRKRVQSVPSLIWNNSYSLNVRAVNSASELAALIKYLEGQP